MALVTPRSRGVTKLWGLYRPPGKIGRYPNSLTQLPGVKQAFPPANFAYPPQRYMKWGFQNE